MKIALIAILAGIAHTASANQCDLAQLQKAMIPPGSKVKVVNVQANVGSGDTACYGTGVAYGQEGAGFVMLKSGQTEEMYFTSTGVEWRWSNKPEDAILYYEHDDYVDTDQDPNTDPEWSCRLNGDTTKWENLTTDGCPDFATPKNFYRECNGWDDSNGERVCKIRDKMQWSQDKIVSRAGKTYTLDAAPCGDYGTYLRDCTCDNAYYDTYPDVNDVNGNWKECP